MTGLKTLALVGEGQSVDGLCCRHVVAHQLACLELDASFLASRVLPGFASGIHQSLLSSTMCQRFCTGRGDAHTGAVANFLCYLPCVISLDLAVSGSAIRNRVVCVPKKDLDNSAECRRQLFVSR